MGDRAAQHPLGGFPVRGQTDQPRLRIGKGIALLSAQDAIHGRLRLGFVQPAILCCGAQIFGGFALQGLIAADKNQIHARVHGGQRALRRAVMALDCIHAHAVAQNQPVKAQLPAQQIVHDAAGHGGGHAVRLQARKQNVAAHDGGDSTLDGCAEGDQLTGFQRRQILVHAGQADVRIHCRIAMSGKVLSAAANVFVLIAKHSLTGKIRYARGIIAKASHTDHGIARVAVYIQHRGKVQVNAETAQLARGDLCRNARVYGIVRRGHGHIARRDDGVRAQTRYHAALLIDGNEGGMAGFRLNQLLDIGAQGTKLGIVHHIVTK